MSDAPAGSKVAFECIGWYQPIVRLLRSLGLEVVLVHARDVALIAKSRKKTDRRDADILCDLLRTNFLPRSYVPTEEAADLRDLTRHADDLVKTMTRVKNNVQCLLERAWVEPPDATDLFGKKGLAFLAAVQLSEAHRVVLDVLLQEFETLQRLHDVLEHEIARRVQHNQDVQLLMTIDGLSFMGAAVLKAEIDNVQRFPNRGTIRSYFGMATSVRDSADTERRGRITKQGPGVVRKILVQGALHFAKDNPNTANKKRRLEAQRGKSVARVAAAGDLLDVAYQVLKTQTPYRYAAEHRLKRKSRELARAAAAPAT